MTFIGDGVTFSKQFLNASGVAANPTTVQIRVREEIDGTEIYWDILPTTPSGFNAISVNPGAVTGLYTLRFVARKLGRLTGYWVGAGNSVNQALVQTFFVRHSGIAAIDEP